MHYTPARRTPSAPFARASLLLGAMTASARSAAANPPPSRHSEQPAEEPAAASSYLRWWDFSRSPQDAQRRRARVHVLSVQYQHRIRPPDHTSGARRRQCLELACSAVDMSDLLHCSPCSIDKACTGGPLDRHHQRRRKQTPRRCKIQSPGHSQHVSHTPSRPAACSGWDTRQ